MGREKCQLLLGGERMIDRQIRRLRSVCRSVAVVSSRTDLMVSEVPIIPDEFPGRGPLGAIFTGLLWTRAPFNLFLGCDLPFMPVGFLRYLARRALESDAEVTVPESHRHLYEPLSAVYRRSVLKTIRSSLETGENKVTRFFPRVRCLVIRRDEILRAGFSNRIFDNMNTPEDYQAAQRLLATDG